MNDVLYAVEAKGAPGESVLLSVANIDARQKQPVFVSLSEWKKPCGGQRMMRPHGMRKRTVKLVRGGT